MAGNLTVSAAIRSHQCYEAVFTVLSLLSNILLLGLVLARRTHGQMRSFRAALLASTITDLFFTAVNGVTMNLITAVGSTILFTHVSPLVIGASQRFQLPLGILWEFALVSAYSTLCFQFAHRYNCVVLRNRWTLTRLMSGYGALEVFAAVSAVVTMTTADRLSAPYEEYAPILIQQGIWVNGRAPVSVNGRAGGLMSVALAINVAHCILCYSTSIYFAVRISQVIRGSQDTVSDNVRSVQRQINLILTAQTLSPLLLINLPFIFNCTLTALGIAFGDLSTPLARGFAVVPFANALTVLIVVPTYRRTLMRMVGLGRVAPSSTAWHSSAAPADLGKPASSSAL